MELEKAYEVIRNSNPRLRFCEWFDENSSMWNFELHSHPYHELIYYMDGKGNADVSGTNLKFSLYDTTVYPAHQQHLDKRRLSAFGSIYRSLRLKNRYGFMRETVFWAMRSVLFIRREREISRTLCFWNMR